ncbi:MAG: fibronectin type III domain-containing protein [Myxococcota bacterium]
MMPPRPLEQAAAAVLAALALCGCGTSLDVDQARRWLDSPGGPELPALGPPGSTELPPPRGVRATSGELRAVPLYWDPLLAGDVGGYAVERASSREGSYQAIAALPGRSATAYLDWGPSNWPGADASRDQLADGETLFYRLRAFDSRGGLSSSVSAVVVGTTAPAPDPPTGLRTFSHQPRQIPLSWDASPDPYVAGYVIERSPTSRGPFEPLADVRGRFDTVYLDQGLGDLRVFHYRISAVNRAGGQGEPSAAVRAVTKSEPLPPLGLGVLGRRLGANRLAWEPNVERDLTGYRLARRRADARKSELVAVLPADSTRALDDAVGADEGITYILTAIDSDGLESDASLLPVTSVGYELSAQAGSDGVELAWNPRRDEGWAGARVFLHGLRTTELGFSPDGRFVHADVEPGERYRYSIVMEAPDGTPAPGSEPIEIALPERTE